MKKHHRKHYPMSEPEKVLWDLCFKMTKAGNPAGARFCADRAIYNGRKRRERDALRDAGLNPYGWDRDRALRPVAVDQR